MPNHNELDPMACTEKDTNGLTISNHSSTSTVLLAPRSRLKSIALVLTCTFVMIINIGNSSSTAISLPTIQRELGLQEVQLQWIISSYPLSSGCLLLVFGRVADVYGRKKTFMSAASFLTIFTLASAFANDAATLAALRGIQGIGAAAILPASLGILAHAFPPSRARSLAFATFSSGAATGAVFGTILGGILTDFTPKTWHSPFYLLTGFDVVILLGGFFSIDADLPSQETDKRIDWIGALLITTGLVFIVFVLSQGHVAPHRWATPYIIVLLIAGIIFVGLFLCWQYYLEKRLDDPKAAYSIFMPPPLMRISLWTRANGRLGAVMLIAFTTWCGFQSFLYWAQLYYQDYRHYSATQNALRFLPNFFSGILCNLFVGLMAAYVPLIFIVGIGTLSAGTAILLFIMSKPSTTYWALEFPSMWLSVLGVDFVFSAGSLFIAKFALPHEQSMAGGLFNTMIQLGIAFGITVTTIVFDSVPLKPGEDVASSYHFANWTSLTFCMIAFLLGVLFLRGIGVVGHRGPKVTSVEVPGKDFPTTDEPQNTDVLMVMEKQDT